jgi:hypothetical protein
VGWSCGRCCGQYFRRFSHFVGKKLAFLLKTKNYVIFPPIQISAIWFEMTIFSSNFFDGFC